MYFIFIIYLFIFLTYRTRSYNFDQAFLVLRRNVFKQSLVVAVLFDRPRRFRGKISDLRGKTLFLTF